MINQTIYFKGYGISQSNTTVVLTVDDQQVYQGPVWSVQAHVEPSNQQIIDNNLYAWNFQSESRSWTRQISIQIDQGDLYLIRHEAVTHGFGGATDQRTLLWNEMRDGRPYFEPKTDVRIDGIPQVPTAVDPAQLQGEWAWKVPSGSTITYTLRSNAVDLALPAWDITRAYVQNDRVAMPGSTTVMFDASNIDAQSVPVASIVNRSRTDAAEVASFVEMISQNAQSPRLTPILVRDNGAGYTLLNGSDQFAARVQMGATEVEVKVVPQELVPNNTRRAKQDVPIGIDITNSDYWE